MASVEDRLKQAGIEVLEARISHLAYSQEIAQAMLRRQQASAVVAARTEIVKGAVGMVETGSDGIDRALFSSNFGPVSCIPILS